MRPQKSPLLASFILMVGLSLMTSCSNDSESDGPASIVGTWDAVELRLDENTATEDELLASDFLEILTAKDCYVLTVRFTEGGTATAENSLNYLDLSGLAVGNFDIPCPNESDSEDATYVYIITSEGGQLTFTDSEGMSSTVGATISGNTLSMDLDGSVFDDVVSEGQLIFRRR